MPALGIQSPQPTSLRLVATLGLAGLFAGCILVGVFLATRVRIERNRAEAMSAAVLKVLPGAVRIAGYALEDGALAPYRGSVGSLPRGRGVFSGLSPDGELVGFAIPADGPGYMDRVGIIYGLDPPRGLVVGMEVLESRETPGLGDRIATDPAFRANFEALAVAPAIAAVKKGKKTRANEVDCITGATISSEAVVAILNESVARWLPLLRAVAAAAGEEAANAD